MNSRIKELRKQAAREVSNANQWTNDDEWNELFMEKFAELIVNQCVRVMYDNAIERKVPPDIDKTPLQYAIAIKEHFGVEE